MKKLFIIGMILTLASGMFKAVFAEDMQEMDPAAIRDAIAKYKQRNFIGCISDLRMYTEKDPSSAIAWYYLGNSYMNISMIPEANDAYNRVVSINTVPILTSYSIQAQMCMQDPTKCEYQNFTRDQIKELRKNPSEFISQYFANIQSQNSDTNAVEIEKLINGEYSNNMHPEVKTFIMQERTKMRQNETNSAGQAYLPQNQKIAEAVKMLNNQTNNSNFAMMLDLPPTTQGAQNQISPEMVQMMIMQNQMSNF
ncbi:MAG: hypothetical protein IJY61_03440 [Candidatus Gastranaerophilales bacterium]|nr:hypothetical protein [Candidatus Gastranaerophilales bacterium]